MSEEETQEHLTGLGCLVHIYGMLTIVGFAIVILILAEISSK